MRWSMVGRKGAMLRVVDVREQRGGHVTGDERDEMRPCVE
jgi:hypothetical protein